MLNYIWAGLIISSLVFAMVSDVTDLSRDTYRNGQALPVRLVFPQKLRQGDRHLQTRIAIDSVAYAGFYARPTPLDSLYTGYLIRTHEGAQLRFAAEATLPEPLATIRGFSASRDDELRGTLGRLVLAPDSMSAVTTIRFEPVRFVKIRAITEAAIEFAETAATLAIGLVGVISLFLGLLRIAEAAGIVGSLVRFTQPIFRPLFPEIPDGHPALGMIVLNLTANMLGLGNAATPLGLKAMEELQKLNPSKDTATNSMVMLLALNTASIQLVPPTLLVAVMGLQVNELIFPIILVTLIGAIAAILAARLLGRLPANRASDPMRQPSTAAQAD